MRLARWLVVEQAGALGVWTAALWAAAVALASVGELVAGLEPGDAFSLPALADRAAAVWPTAVVVAAPLAIAWHAGRLSERGERAALAALGVGPWRVAPVLAAPALVLVGLLCPFVHDVRPAVLAATHDRLVEGALRSRHALLQALRDAGAGVLMVDGRLHLLAPLPDGALAVTAASLTRTGPGILVVGPGRAWRVAGGDAGHTAHAARFTRVELRLPGHRVSLAERGENELRTRFLRAHGARWIRARLAREPSDRPAVLRAREIVRRRLATPLAALAVVLAAALALPSRAPRPPVAITLVGLPGALLGLLGPDLAGRLAAGGG